MTFELVYGKSPFGLKRPQDISKIVFYISYSGNK